MMYTLLFHGPSGCGKDTQLDLLISDFPFVRIGTGDILRRMYEKGDPDAIEAHSYWAKGQFSPSELTYRILKKWMVDYDNKKNWVFVSVVRKADQIALFDDLLNHYDRKLDLFVHYKLSEEAAIERLSLRSYCTTCGRTYHSLYKIEKVKGHCDFDGTKLIQREDDKPDSIKRRLLEYNSSIAEILEEYRKRDVLIEIDASPSIDQVHTATRNALKLRNVLK